MSAVSLLQALKASLFRTAPGGAEAASVGETNELGVRRETANWSQVTETRLTKTEPEINSLSDLMMTSGCSYAYMGN